MLIDSHAHLNDQAFAGEIDAVIQRAKQAGVAKIVNVGCDLPSSLQAVMTAQQYAGVYAAAGIHPQDCERTVEQDFTTLAGYATQPKVVAIGEIGLDYFRNPVPRDIQQRVFIAQLELAKHLDKPVIIHDRDAHGDTLDILKNHAQGVRGVLHCFSGSYEFACEAIKLGFYISFTGSVTFHNAVKLQEVARKIPLNRLMVETDCPYLTPVPCRGQRNEPAHVVHTARFLAGLLQVDFEELAQITTDNAVNLLCLS